MTSSTTEGASAGDSEIGTGHLLQEAKYPDSASGTDVVTFAYNAQNQEIYRKDQSGNVFEIDYDDSGRQEHRRVTTLASGFDGAVRRISTTYDSLGRRDLVTQYDNATVGSGSVVDEVKFTYEDWGNVSKLQQDVNSAVDAAGSVDDMEISYTYIKDTTSWKNVRRKGMTLPDGTALTYEYLTTDGLDAIWDDDVSRVSRIKVSTTEVARYWYNGLGSVVGTIHAESDIMWKLYSSGSYPDLDRFNRVTSSRWTKDLATDLDFFDLDITYDRNSNIDVVEDNIHVHGNGLDVEYTNDDLNRLTQAEQGVWGGSSITSTSHDQIWTLDQVGNWDLAQLDVNGDGDFTDTDEYNDDRTHNDVNELTGRDTDDNGTDDYTLVYDAVGNLTDDNEHYKYEYDAFGRLRKITKQSDALVAEYRYNGLNYRCSWHYDVDGDGTVESTSDDPWFHFTYDDRWRIVATVHEDDLDGSIESKEQFVYHNAGRNGRGGSSYIDHVVLRDKDANTVWEDASDETLEERIYFCHNWRGDISVLIDDTGEMVEWVKYSAYGIPYGIPASDTNSDGTVDGTDTTNVNNWSGNSDKPTGDHNLDGTIDTADETAARTTNWGNTLGWGTLSLVDNRKGYAGHEGDADLTDTIWHVRNRTLNSDLGLWTRRDPRGAIDGPNLYGYVAANPAALRDPNGLASITVHLQYLNIEPCPQVSAEALFLFEMTPPQGEDGWLVQRVKVDGESVDCRTRAKDDTFADEEFLEAFYVPANKKLARAPKIHCPVSFNRHLTTNIMFVDRSGLRGAGADSMGFVSAVGDLRFFTESSLEGQGAKPDSWPPGGRGYGSPFGWQPAPGLEAGSVPQAGCLPAVPIDKAPKWWDTVAPTVTGGRSHHLGWCCCDDFNLGYSLATGGGYVSIEGPTQTWTPDEIINPHRYDPDC